ncbi:hypothetical protein AB0I60_18075 [Actinosynnema sp. NPDC050436]|uniref:hypothetical protein n=1 Tax=Actinosynnema sp. NPDC050436 TaxID=3155659 RepID=UPI0033EA8DB1
MRKTNSSKRVIRTVAAVAVAAGALTVSAGTSVAATGTVGALSGCTTTNLSVVPATRTADWTVSCTDRRYVYADVTVFAGGVADSNPSEAQWVNAGSSWQDHNVYPQTTPAVDHICVHIVTYVDPTDPFEQPQVIGHSCV